MTILTISDGKGIGIGELTLCHMCEQYTCRQCVGLRVLVAATSIFIVTEKHFPARLHTLVK